MSSMTESFLQNFRRRLDSLRALDAAVGSFERRLSENRQWLFQLKAERARIESSIWSPQVSIQRETEAKLKELAETVRRVQAEVDYQVAELARLQSRRDDATHLACRCRDYLREQGALPRELDF